jgi:tetratricopeptide (TPR) repeat protein
MRNGVHTPDDTPDPSAVESASDFVARLRRLKAWAGDPSFEQLARASGVPRSTLADALNTRRQRLPALDVVRRFVRACGVGDEGTADWETAWRRLRAAANAATPAGADRGVQAPSAGPANGVSSPPRVLDIPEHLPLGVPGFAGRGAALAQLDKALAAARDRPQATAITALLGAAGVGKTALALHWARRVADQFPDGQLHVNLRGFDARQPAMSPAQVIRRFLSAFGLATWHIPVDLDAQAGLYRDLLAGRRVLIVLDNARDADQVRPLLPGSPGSFVLVTSRNRLSGLVTAQGAHPIVLDVLPVDEARRLLAQRIGDDRVAAHPYATEEIINQCARLPLALAIVGARVATHPTFPLDTLAAELRDTKGGLDRFAGADAATNVHAVFSSSYHAVSAPAARIFRLLGLHPDADIGTLAVAAMADVPVERVRLLLAELDQTNLITERAPGRFAFHDLLREYAAELAHSLDSEPERHAARRRLFDHYLHTAHRAAMLLNPHRDPIPLPEARSGTGSEELSEREHALAWFTAEHSVLLSMIDQAAHAGFGGHAWRLAWTLAEFFEWRGHWHDWYATQQAGLAAAQRLGDRPGQACAHRDLACACSGLGRFDDAYRHLGQALDLFDELGDRVGQARTHLVLGCVFDRQNRRQQALHHCQRAFELYYALGHRAGQATALAGVGWCHAHLGQPLAAIDDCRQAIRLYQKLGHRWGEAVALATLGYAYQRLGRHQEATGCFQGAIELNREIGDGALEAEALTLLGNACHADGDTTSAHDAWRQALTILDEIGDPQADQVRVKLGQS